jgi:hypothetical protein
MSAVCSERGLHVIQYAKGNPISCSSSYHSNIQRKQTPGFAPTSLLDFGYPDGPSCSVSPLSHLCLNRYYSSISNRYHTTYVRYTLQKFESSKKDSQRHLYNPTGKQSLGCGIAIKAIAMESHNQDTTDLFETPPESPPGVGSGGRVLLNLWHTWMSMKRILTNYELSTRLMGR